MAGSTAVQDVVMPRLSDSMEEGTILSWHKAVGDTVAVGEGLAEIETDKANMDYESDVAGTVLEILVGEGDTAAVGAVIARVGDPEDADDSTAGPVTDASPTVPAVGDRSAPRGAPASAAPAEVATDANGSRARVKASPLARRLAQELGVDLGALAGSGPGGRVVKKDVEAAPPAGGGAEIGAPGGAERSPIASTVGEISGTGPSAGADTSPETAKGKVTVEEPTKPQQVVARRMAESKATAPHFYLTAEVDMGNAVAARARIKAISGEGDVVPSFNDMVVKACALALRDFPRANGAYKDGRFELYSRVNVGIAVAAEDALVVPTVFDADRKGLREIAGDARRLAGKVRDSSITPPELSGATFTVSNLGMFGVRSFDAVINSPQAGILAVGEIADQPAVRDGQIVAAKLMEITLSCDHRILYGADGAQFLARVRSVLEEPIGLAL